MPKVSDEYKQEIKRNIVYAAESAGKNKPAYAVTMRDVIREAGLSPGAVYSYYQDIDDIWIAYMNTLLCEYCPESAKDPGYLADWLTLGADESREDYLDRCFSVIEDIFRHLSRTQIKLIYELEIKRVSDPEFAKKRRESAYFVEIYKLLLHSMAQAISPEKNTDSIYIFLKSWLEGFAKNYVECCFSENAGDIDVREQLNILKAIVRRLSDVQK